MDINIPLSTNYKLTSHLKVTYVMTGHFLLLICKIVIGKTKKNKHVLLQMAMNY